MPVKNKITELLLFSTIVSLPFYNLRGMFFGLPISFYLCSMAIIFFIYKFLTGGVKLKLGYFDALIFAYLVWCLLSVLTNPAESSGVVLAKTLFYFVVYLSLKGLVAQLERGRLQILVVKSVKVGALLYTLFVVYMFFAWGGGVGADFGYWTFTYKLFSESGIDFTGTGEFKSASLMRSTIGEVFAFYFICMLLFANKSLKPRLYMVLDFLLAVLMFSRRAVVSILLSLFLSKINNIKYALAIVPLAITAVLYFGGLEDNSNRLLSLESNERVNMYEDAFAEIKKEYLFGYGFGKKLGDERYVHNFVIATFYMTGVIGGLLSLLIVIELVRHIVYSIVVGRSGVGLMLIIPFMGAMVGSTVEGMFTVTSWVVFALYFSMKKQTSVYLTLKQKELV